MDKKFFRSILLIIFITILMIYALWNISVLTGILVKILSVIRPILIGFVIAFILNNPFKLFLKLYSKLFKKSKTNKAASVLATVTVYLLLILILTFILIFMLPELISSFRDLSNNLSIYISNIQHFINNIIDKLDNNIPKDFNINEKIESYFENLPKMIFALAGGIFGFTQNLISSIIDIILGLFISVYLLFGKNKLYGQFRKICSAYLSQNKNKSIDEFIGHASKTFTNFITGQLIEACILGTLCFIGMKIFKFEYAFLISFFIGITNLIPIVGPFIGAIPAVLLLFMISPVKALYFIIYILCLQQFEGNIIYPRVVGSKVGLPALWVLLAVIIGGGTFGIFGMMLAVPTMSIIYDSIRVKVKKRIEEKSL